MRPTYETSNDRANESKAVAIYCAQWGQMSATKLPISYRVDYAFHNEGSLKISGWAEVKCRSHKSDTYKTLIISLGKMMAGIELAHRTSLPFILIISFSDKVMFRVFTSSDVFRNPMIGGRTDKTRDDADIEPIVHLCMTKFKDVRPTQVSPEAVAKPYRGPAGAPPSHSVSTQPQQR